MNNSKNSVRTLTMLALLVAMSIVFSRVLSISTGFVRFNLGSLPVLLAAVALLLRWPAFGSFRYKFSLFLFAVAMAEALLLVEGGDRLYHANLWWGPFICFWVLWLESVGIFLKQALAKPKSASTVLCGMALGWHIISGVCYLVRLMQGVSYNVPIMTYHIGF